MNVRDAVGDDYEGIKNVQRTTWLDTYPNKKYGITKKEIEERFNQPPRRPIEEAKKALEGNDNGRYWVAEENGKIIGFCSALRKDDRDRIGAIYVLPNCQGKGIGKKLITKGLDWLGNDKDIYIGVASYNNKAIKFYESLGFVYTHEIGHSPASKLPFGSVIPEVEMIRKVINS